MDRTPTDFQHGDPPDLPEYEEAEAWFRQAVEVAIADDDDDRAPECMTDEEVHADWARQRARLYERMEQLRRAAESEP